MTPTPTVDGWRPAAGFNFHQHLERQRRFSEKTFGPGSRAKGVVDHIRKELREIENNPGDLYEWIDVAMLALDGAWRTGATPEHIISALVAKQTKNEARDWPDWRTLSEDQAIEHIRSEPMAASAQGEDYAEQVQRLREPYSFDGSATTARIRLGAANEERRRAADAIEKLVAERDEKESERKRFDIALQRLTPGGSEYVNDPDRCVAVVRETQETQHELILKRTKERDSLKDDIEELVRERDSAREGVWTMGERAASQRDSLKAENEELRTALGFYADPETYFAIGFFPDPPCGAFVDDFDENHDLLDFRPGKRARDALKDEGA